MVPQPEFALGEIVPLPAAHRGAGHASQLQTAHSGLGDLQGGAELLAGEVSHSGKPVSIIGTCLSLRNMLTVPVVAWILSPRILG